MRKYSILTLMMILAGLSVLTTFTVSAQQVSEGQRLAMFSKPSVVRIYDGANGRLVRTLAPPGTEQAVKPSAK